MPVDTESIKRLSDALHEEGVSDSVSVYVRTMLGYRGITASDLSRALGIDKSLVSRRLTGQQAWKPLEVFALADMWGVPIEDILAGVPDPAAWRFTG